MSQRRGEVAPGAPSVLDYHSDSPTFALSISPLSTPDPSSLRLAVGSYNEHRTASLPPASSSSGGTHQQQQQQQGNNHLTICSLDPAYLDLDDDSSDEHDLSYRHRHTRQRVQAGSAFRPVARAHLLYPPSAVQFAPARLSTSLQSGLATAGGGGHGEQREVVATSSECLRLWDLVTGPDDALASAYVGQAGQGGGPRSRLVSRATLQNSKADYSAPLTSFSWSVLEPTHIVTSSIDTTCTVWDISTGAPVTQLIAHDREVYDVAWSPASREVFASVGADGSVRMFDLRSLEHSTILYEAAPSVPSSSTNSSGGGSSTNPGQNGSASGPSPPELGANPKGSSSSSSSTAIPSPLLRLAFSPTSPTYLSVVHADSGDVQILDTRSPGTPAFEVKGHTAAVNGMAWGGATMCQNTGGETSGPGWLATVSDDANLLLWDLTTSQPNAPPTSRSVAHQPKPITVPSMAYTAPSEINTVAMGWEWVAIGCGKLVRCLKI
ncbi:hypothetical protein JCM10212_001543 [Sporobolomyces blumeae]